jgi:TonB-linked SusC/RagA family outer membrane protein
MRKITPLLMVLMLVISSAIAQVRNVTGKVIDASGTAVPYVTITVKGTKSAVAANDNGIFTIKAKTGDVLVVSGVGLQAQEIKVTTDPILNVSVVRVSSNLTEVVVTALGIQKQAKEVGYSTATVASKDLVAAKPISVANGLTGKVSGLEIQTTNNGLFAPTRITMRGNRSLTGANTPLIVVDGAIFYNDISTLNPNDIIDINVLKGASASAVYGSDASNGVLLITTKHGSRGKPTLTYSSTVQFETLSYLPKLQTQFGSNGGEYFVDNFNDLSTYVPFENQSYGPTFNGKLVPLGRPTADGSIDMVPYSFVNGQRNFFQTGITTQNDMTFSGGDETGRFFLSAQDVNTTAIMPGDLGRRDAFSFGGSKTYGVFSAEYRVNYTNTYRNTTNTNTVYTQVLNTPGEVNLPNFSNWQSNKFADLNGWFNDYADNPYWDAANYRNIQRDNNFTGNLKFGLKATKWLTLSYRMALTNLSGTFSSQNQGQTYSSYAATSPVAVFSNAAGTGLTYTSAWGPKYNASLGNTSPTYVNQTYSRFLFTSDFVASFNKKLSKDFNLTANLGTTYLDNKNTGTYVNAGNLYFPVFNINNITSPLTASAFGGSNYFKEARKFGLFGEATVGFRNYAFLHGAYRTDIDSRLSTSNRFIPYYDIDASLVLSDMFPAIVNNKVLSFAKLRGAHSLTGNASALGGGSTFIADGAYVINPIYSVATGGYLLSSQIANPNLKPEQITEDEIGAELGFFKNRISLGASVYKQNLTQGIVTANVAPSSGSTTALLNAANTTNTGVELDLKATVVSNKHVKWDVGINYTHITSNVVSINGGQTSLGLATYGNGSGVYDIVGNPFPYLKVTDWARDPSGHVIVDATTGLPSLASNPIFSGVVNPTDLLGITTSVSWKAFTLTATADYRGGNKLLNMVDQYMDFTGISASSAVTGRQRFVFPNSVIAAGGGKYTPNTNVSVDDANFNFWPGLERNAYSNYVSSAAFWKLRDVSISYEIPKKAFGFTKIVQKATFTVSGRNLLMFVPKTNQGIDPEFSSAGTGSNAQGYTSTGNAPPTRIVSATLAVTF